MLIEILQPSYLPWLGFFEQMATVDSFVLYDDVQYDKRGWRNRNSVKNSHGVQWLSVPILTKGKRSQLINQARINPASKWGSKHLTSLETNYKKTIYFDHFYCQIELLFNKKWNYLLDLNLNLLNLLKEYLGIKTQIILSSSFIKKIASRRFS
jgi:hypothetical protein